MEIVQTGKICKVNDELKVIYGWASVITKNKTVVTDTQGDQILPTDLIKCAHEFMSEARKGGFMHVPGIEGGQVVESMVFTYDLQKALGVEVHDQDGNHIEGWLIGYKVNSDTLWKRVKSGEFAEFSIGGEAVRVPVEA